MISTIPEKVKRVFRSSSVKNRPDLLVLANPPATPEERLWRERAARMTLDALGYTNLTVKPYEHNEAVGYARRWFRQMYTDHTDINESDDAQATFDSAGVVFDTVRNSVLNTNPIIFNIDQDGELDV